MASAAPTSPRNGRAPRRPQRENITAGGVKNPKIDVEGKHRDADFEVPLDLHDQSVAVNGDIYALRLEVETLREALCAAERARDEEELLEIAKKEKEKEHARDGEYLSHVRERFVRVRQLQSIAETLDADLGFLHTFFGSTEESEMRLYVGLQESACASATADLSTLEEHLQRQKSYDFSEQRNIVSEQRARIGKLSRRLRRHQRKQRPLENDLARQLNEQEDNGEEKIDTLERRLKACQQKKANLQRKRQDLRKAFAREREVVLMTSGEKKKERTVKGERERFREVMRKRHDERLQRRKEKREMMIVDDGNDEVFQITQADMAYEEEEEVVVVAEDPVQERAIVEPEKDERKHRPKKAKRERKDDDGGEAAKTDARRRRKKKDRGKNGKETNGERNERDEGNENHECRTESEEKIEDNANGVESKPHTKRRKGKREKDRNDDEMKSIGGEYDGERNERDEVNEIPECRAENEEKIDDDTNRVESNPNTECKKEKREEEGHDGEMKPVCIESDGERSGQDERHHTVKTRSLNVGVDMRNDETTTDRAEEARRTGEDVDGEKFKATDGKAQERTTQMDGNREDSRCVDDERTKVDAATDDHEEKIPADNTVEEGSRDEMKPMSDHIDEKGMDTAGMTVNDELDERVDAPDTKPTAVEDKSETAGREDGDVDQQVVRNEGMAEDSKMDQPDDVREQLDGGVPDEKMKVDGGDDNVRIVNNEDIEKTGPIEDNETHESGSGRNGAYLKVFPDADDDKRVSPPPQNTDWEQLDDRVERHESNEDNRTDDSSARADSVPNEGGDNDDLMGTSSSSSGVKVEDDDLIGDGFSDNWSDEDE